MKLKSFGCSFVYGNDLPDCLPNTDRSYPNPSHMTWPCLLAKSFGISYACHAWPGTGNLKIFERILHQCQDPEPAIFVVSWTWIDRFDYIKDDQNPWENWSWQSVMPDDKTDFSKMYFRHYHAQNKDQLLNLVLINQAIDVLDNLRIPYVMTYQDNLLFEDLYIPHAGIKHLQTKIKKHMHDFQGISFLQWSKKMGFEISSNWHPLVDAHRSASDYILENWILDNIKETVHA